MDPKLTNLRARVTPPPPAKTAVSVVELESTRPPTRRSVEALGPRTLLVRLEGLALNMDPFERMVLDGVVRSVRLDQGRTGGVLCRLELEFPVSSTRPRIEVETGIPVVTRITLDRQPLREVLGGRRIAIDPGHGGRDAGARGPINLEERHVVLQIARRLAVHLEEAGAAVALTRRDDRFVEPHLRMLAAVTHRAQVLVSLHTLHEPPDRCQGMAVRFGAGVARAEAEAIARAIASSLRRRLGLPEHGVQAMHWPSAAATRVPVVQVEVPCIAHPLEEALLRSVVFKDRIAQAIRNALAAHWGAAHQSGGAAAAL